MIQLVRLAIFSLVLLIITPLAAYASQLDEGIQAYERQDYQAAYKRLLPLAEKGDGKAQYYVGEMLVGGMGVSSNIDKGVYWLEQSVNNRNHMAAKTLGKMYLSGFGVPMDTEKGAKYFALLPTLIPENEDEPECD